MQQWATSIISGFTRQATMAMGKAYQGQGQHALTAGASFANDQFHGYGTKGTRPWMIPTDEARLVQPGTWQVLVTWTRIKISMDTKTKKPRTANVGFNIGIATKHATRK